MRILKVADGPIYHLAYSPDGRHLIIQDGEPMSGNVEPVRSVRWWTWPEGIEERTWSVRGPATFSPDQGLVVAATTGPRASALYDGRSLEPVRGVALTDAWTEFGFSPDCRWLVEVVRSDDDRPSPGMIQLPKARWITPARGPRIAAHISFSLDGKRFATGGDSEQIVIAPGDREDLEYLAEFFDCVILPGHDGTWVRRFLFLNESTVVALGWPTDFEDGPPPSGPGRGSVWDVTGRSFVTALEGHADRITALAVSADGKQVVDVALDGTAILRDPRTWAVRKTFVWDVGKLHSVAFSPNGETCAAGSEDGRVVVWDMIE